MSYVTKTDDSLFDSDIHKTNVTLVDFYADWCEPCKQMAPILEDVARDGFGDVGVLKVNVDDNIASKICNVGPIKNIAKTNTNINLMFSSLKILTPLESPDITDNVAAKVINTIIITCVFKPKDTSNK